MMRFSILCSVLALLSALPCRVISLEEQNEPKTPVLVEEAAQEQEEPNDTPVLMWASQGAGSRGFPWLGGLTNIFYQAGLITETSCKFKSMSGGSSGAWFLTLLFFSKPYFERTVLTDPQGLKDFIREWFVAFGEIWNIPGDVRRRGFFRSALFDLIVGQAVGNPFFWENILEITSMEIGDKDFPNRPTTPENRVPAMQQTEMMLGTAIHPNHRVKEGFWRGDTLTYLGPSNSEDVYTTPISYQYAVKNDRTMFFTGLPQEQLPIKTCVTKFNSKMFYLTDWKKFPLYPQNHDGNGSLLLPKSEVRSCVQEAFAKAPFGGGTPSAIQAATMSSATWSEYTSKAPSSFAQTLSVEHYRTNKELQNSRLKRLRAHALINTRAQFVWQLDDRLWNLSVGFQYPRKGKVHDPQFSHANNLLGATLPMQIAQHQEVDGLGTKDRLKVILTIPGLSPNTFLEFFGQDYNVDIEPGSYSWRPNGYTEGSPTTAPWTSLRIFDLFLPVETFNTMRVPVGEGTYISTVELTNLTTIDNAAMHVHAGQKVDMLVIISDDDFPLTQALGYIPGQAKAESEEFGEMARVIASSQTLLQRVSDFTSEYR